MKKVVDPEGVTWRVRRWWWNTVPWQTGFDTLDTIFFLLMLPFLLMWPFWLAAKWLGVAWSIRIERDGREVASERVRGWRASGRRIDELAEQAEAGTLEFIEAS